MTARVCLALRPDTPADVALLRAAVVGWAVARASGGDLVVRSTGTGADPALRGLSWLGIDWDEGPAPDPEMAAEPFTHLIDLGANPQLPGSPAPLILSPLPADEGRLTGTLPRRYTADGLAGMGYLPAAVFNFLALLDWPPPDGAEILSRWDIRSRYDPAALRPTPLPFDWARLNRINRHYLDQLSVEALADLVRPFLEDVYDELPMHGDWLLRLTAVIRGRMDKLEDAVDLAVWAFDDTPRPTPAAATILGDPAARAPLTRATAEAATVVLLDERTAAGIVAALERDFAAATDPRAILTAALTGEPAGWPPAEVMALLGKERTLRRLAAALR